MTQLFADTSALIKLVVEEPSSAEVLALGGAPETALFVCRLNVSAQMLGMRVPFLQRL